MRYDRRDRCCAHTQHLRRGPLTEPAAQPPAANDFPRRPIYDQFAAQTTMAAHRNKYANNQLKTVNDSTHLCSTVAIL